MSLAFHVLNVRLTACALFALVLAGGCASLWTKKDEDSYSSRLAAYPNKNEVKQASAEEPAEDPKPLTWSDFTFEKWGKTSKRLTGQGENRNLARQYYREGYDFFEQAKKAEPHQRAHIFAMAVPKFAAAADRWPDSQLAMDALFMAGESAFFADEYVLANTYYEKLVKAFPNNRYLDQVDKRRFSIARFWLQTNHQHAEPWYYVNWTNKERPWKDIRGHGLRVFDKIRIDDPTGKLADDATLAAGNEYFENHRFYKADDYYTDLRKAYPTSEHQFLAHFLGIKAKLNSYMGPAYGGTALDECEKLIKQTRRQFPVEAEKEREYLDKALAEVRFRKAEQLMHMAHYYDRRAEYRAADHFYTRVVREFRDTPLAKEAEDRIGQIAGRPPVPPKPFPWLIALLPESDKVKPLLKASQKAQAEQAQTAATEVAAAPEQYNPNQPQGTVQR
jgi:outer membrane protein assembly factor BamD (BamD/ComL family)